MKLMILIVPKKESNKIAKIIGDNKISFLTTVPAHGTATTEMLEYLSLGDIDTDLLLSIVDDADVTAIFETLEHSFEFVKRGKGVAFTVEINAVTKLGYQFLYQQTETKGALE